MRAQSLGGSPPFCVSKFIGASGWPERLGCTYCCFGSRSARGVRGWLFVTQHPQFGPFRTVLVRMLDPVFVISVGFLRVPVSVFCFIFFLLSILNPTSCGEGERGNSRGPNPAESWRGPNYTVVQQQVMSS